MKMTSCDYVIKRIAALFLCAVFAMLVFAPSAVYAEKEEKTVRVGWYESSYCTTDDTGRRSGYAYEYQMKIAAYTGWKYEYVSGSWTELLQMLIDGDLDLMSDVSYTDERSEKILYPELPMGTEEYYIFMSPGNKEISRDELSTLNGKTIGVNKGSFQEDCYLKWAEKHGIEAEVKELTGSEENSLMLLESGKIDAYITPDAFADPTQLSPVAKIGASDYYFAVNKKRQDLLEDLNHALSCIQDENRHYNERMSEKYLIRSGSNAFLTSAESEWLEKHGPIKVGYQDNYMAFCAQDKETGELTGALKDYLEYLSKDLKNASLEFQPVPYRTAAEALDALNRSEVDCVFPANLSGYDAELNDVSMTHPMMQSDMFAIVRKQDQDFFNDKEHVIVAVNEGNPNYDAFLEDYFPQWRKVYFTDTEECLEHVSKGVADCVLISSYRYSSLEKLCNKYGLVAADTGIGLDYCFAVDNGHPQLYSLLTKAIGQVPETVVSTAIAYYVTENAKTTFVDLITENIYIVLAVIALIVAVILFLMFRSMNAEKKAKDLIAKTEIDAMTGLYNRDYFFEYANRMYHEHPDALMDAVVINIEQFHSVNALNGRDFGNQVLRTLGKEIQNIAESKKGVAGRFGADRFDIYCQRIEDYQAVFDRLQGKLEELAPNVSVRIRMGVMQSQPDVEPVQMFDMARTACNMARGYYKTHLVVFDDEVHEREMYEQRLLNDLRRALNEYEFKVYYQPKYDIQEEPPKLVSAEALVRWDHPVLGLISPDDFIPIFEQSGKIGELDKFVWNEAARQIVSWREIYGRVIPVSVNLSRVDIFDPELEKTLDDIMTYNGLEHDALKLEVTETAYTEDSEQVVKVIGSLRSKGYVVEMDDFGTGYSSLNMLAEMPVDVIKMDMGFVRNIEYSEKDRQLANLIINIAQKLDVSVVAEGVETGDQLRILKDMGCECVQGFYFSRPLPPSEFEDQIIMKEE